MVLWQRQSLPQGPSLTPSHLLSVFTSTYHNLHFLVIYVVPRLASSFLKDAKTVGILALRFGRHSPMLPRTRSPCLPCWPPLTQDSKSSRIYIWDYMEQHFFIMPCLSPANSFHSWNKSICYILRPWEWCPFKILKLHGLKPQIRPKPSKECPDPKHKSAKFDERLWQQGESLTKHSLAVGY